MRPAIGPCQVTYCADEAPGGGGSSSSTASGTSRKPKKRHARTTSGSGLRAVRTAYDTRASASAASERVTRRPTRGHQSPNAQ
eukprot:1005522-Heterocapsa_arctica.AAC.1